MVAILYLLTITGFFLIAAVAAALIRLALLTPQGDVLTAEGYNRAFTMHGVIMVWFFLIPSIPHVFGNFLITLMIGARALAFPRSEGRRVRTAWARTCRYGCLTDT